MAAALPLGYASQYYVLPETTGLGETPLQLGSNLSPFNELGVNGFNQHSYTVDSLFARPLPNPGWDTLGDEVDMSTTIVGPDLGSLPFGHVDAFDLSRKDAI